MASAINLRASAIRHGDLLSPDAQSLSGSERARLGKLVSPEKRENLLKSVCAVRLGLSDWLSLAPEEIVLDHDIHGAPHLPDFPNLKISISRSADWTALALVPERRIGIDLEAVREIGWSQMLPMICDTDEESALRQLCGTDTCPTPFFRVWTAKEAALKANGRGFAYGAKRVVIPAGIARGEVTSADLTIEGATYHLSCFNQGDVIGALAIAENQPLSTSARLIGPTS